MAERVSIMMRRAGCSVDILGERSIRVSGHGVLLLSRLLDHTAHILRVSISKQIADTYIDVTFDEARTNDQD